MVRVKTKPSQAKYWMNCPGFAKLVCQIPWQSMGDAAREGIKDHKLAEDTINSGVPAELTNELTEGQLNALYYANSVLEISTDERKVEDRLTFPNSGGCIIDFWCIKPDGTLVIVDYKSGRTPVEAEGNDQLVACLMAIIETHGMKFKAVELGICQPNVSPYIGWWKLTVEQAIFFYQRMQKVTAGIRVKPSEIGCKPGSWCVYCPAATKCSVQRKACVNLMGIVDLPEYEGLSLNEMGAELSRLEDAQKIFKHRSQSLRVQIEHHINEGSTVLGWSKSISKKGSYKWKDGADLSTLELFYPKVAKQSQYVTPTQLLKLTGVAGKPLIEQLAERAPDHYKIQPTKENILWLQIKEKQ